MKVVKIGIGVRIVLFMIKIFLLDFYHGTDVVHLILNKNDSYVAF